MQYSLPIPQISSLRKHPLVCSVALVCCFPFLALTVWGLPAISGWFMPASAHDILQMPWRLFSPIFIHYTVFHLFSNIYIWWYFGAKIEQHSRLELLGVLLICAIAGNVAQWYFSGAEFGGLSGVTYGLLSYCWTITFLYKTNILQLDKALSIILLAFLPLSATGLFGNYSNAAHLAGLICGVLMAAVKFLLSNNSQRT